MNTSTQKPPNVVRFGAFEADFGRLLLTKGGLRVKLQEQPFKLLGLLLERPGEIVSREEIRQALWSADTFVEFDDGLNTAIKKLRAALADSAENPRYIETVPRRGYRFTAPVARALPEPAAPASDSFGRTSNPFPGCASRNAADAPSEDLGDCCIGCGGNCGNRWLVFG